MRVKGMAGVLAAGVGLSVLLSPGIASADQQGTAKSSKWECQPLIWQNDGDAGGRSGKATWRYDKSTSNYVQFTFQSLDERMTLTNHAGRSAEAYVKRSSNGKYLGRLDVRSDQVGAKADLNIAEGTELTLVLNSPSIGRCTTTKVIA